MSGAEPASKKKRDAAASNDDDDDDNDDKQDVPPSKLHRSQNKKSSSSSSSARQREERSIREGRPQKEGAEMSSSASGLLDIESALQYILTIPATAPAAEINEDADKSSEQNDGTDPEKEYLDSDRQTYVTFRAAHSGDASTIANLYNKSKEQESPTVKREAASTEKEKTSSSESQEQSVEGESPAYLELWLAEGLGDEDTPPSVYSILGYVHSQNENAKSPKLGSIVILTLGWDSDSTNLNGKRVLRVEWLYTDVTLSPMLMDRLQRRLWLRLALLSTLSKCDLLLVEKKALILSHADTPPRTVMSSE